jgi:hypothetical protein
VWQWFSPIDWTTVPRLPGSPTRVKHEALGGNLKGSTDTFGHVENFPEFVRMFLKILRIMRLKILF